MKHLAIWLYILGYISNHFSLDGRDFNRVIAASDVTVWMVQERQEFNYQSGIPLSFPKLPEDIIELQLFKYAVDGELYWQGWLGYGEVTNTLVYSEVTPLPSTLHLSQAASR